MAFGWTLVRVWLDACAVDVLLPAAHASKLRLRTRSGYSSRVPHDRYVFKTSATFHTIALQSSGCSSCSPKEIPKGVGTRRPRETPRTQTKFWLRSLRSITGAGLTTCSSNSVRRCQLEIRELTPQRQRRDSNASCSSTPATAGRQKPPPLPKHCGRASARPAARRRGSLVREGRHYYGLRLNRPASRQLARDVGRANGRAPVCT
jgi:hypothetical protein